MNKNTIIGAIALIAFLPLFYLVMNAFQSEELPSFGGRTLAIIDASQGTITAPSPQDAAKGAPLIANYTGAFVERITQKKMTSTKNLNLSISLVVDEIQDCDPDNAIPPQAGFSVAQICAPYAFEKINDPKKTAFYMVPEEKLIVFGKSGQSLTRVYHHGMVATYESADMTQSDRRYEACLVRIMMDFTVGFAPNPDNSCAVG